MLFFKIPKGIVIATAAIGASSLLLTEMAATTSLNSGLPARFDPAPNYPLCTTDNDAMKLSDGAVLGMKSAQEGSSLAVPELLPGLTPDSTTRSALWALKSTVGWVHPGKPIVVTFDLGKSERIGGISVSSAAGTSGVYWPAAISMIVSEDGETWSYAGELISRSRKQGLPPAMEYREHLFEVNDLSLQARYVGICIHTGGSSMFFTDEIAIRRGDTSRPAEAARLIGPLDSVRAYVRSNTVSYNVLRRLAVDHDTLLQRLRASSLDAGLKAGYEARLQMINDESEEARIPDVLPHDFSTIIPLHETQRRILSLYGELLREEGYPPLLVTKAHRNSYLGWLETPAQKAQDPVALEFRQMRNETRADLLLLTNATGETQKVTLTLPDQAQAYRLYRIPWTDTPQLQPVATALLPMEAEGKSWHLEIPPGLTMKVYVSLDASKLQPGAHAHRLHISGAREIEIPVKTEISSIAMNPERLYLGMWDYTNGNGAYDIRPDNLGAAIRLMKSHGVNSPWATPGILPPLTPDFFDANHRLIKLPDFNALDEWLGRWPEARRYMIFLNVSNEIAGAPLGTPAFAERVRQWATALANHLLSKGVEPRKLHLCLVDEAHTDSGDQRFSEWAKSIRAATDEIVLWNNPIRRDPGISAHPEAYTLPDVLCPNWGILAQEGERLWAYYDARRQAGQALELYTCSALAPHTDPGRYFRMMPWAGWRLRIQGIGFWSFADAGGLKNAWQAYGETGGRINYSPAFLSENDATDTLQWRGVQEGVLDYEYLRMLEKALPGIDDPALKAEAEALLSPRAIRKLFHGWKGSDHSDWSSASHWGGGHHWEATDVHRKKILVLLERLHQH